nr:hypothetical protein CTRU02_01725 [Colletotrichum truncatum]
MSSSSVTRRRTMPTMSLTWNIRTR